MMQLRANTFSASIAPCPFPRTPECAINYARRWTLFLGQGHNVLPSSTTVCAASVVPLLWAKSPHYQGDNSNPQRHNGKMHPLSYDRMSARAHEAKCVLCRCAVVPSFYLSVIKEKKKKIGHNTAHNTSKIGPKTVVGTVVPCCAISAKSMFSNKKGGFERG